jgi:hypothetical protein
MTRYSRPSAQQPGEVVGDDRICSSCRHHVSKGDEYCSGCGVSFSPLVEPDVPDRTLPGFSYHFVQAFGWGLGFAAAGATVMLILYAVFSLLLYVTGYHGYTLPVPASR